MRAMQKDVMDMCVYLHSQYVIYYTSSLHYIVYI